MTSKGILVKEYELHLEKVGMSRTSLPMMSENSNVDF